ncbi:nucleoside hydrolase [Curvibacter sp. CHRR-16]|uniref:nucleoside hydrolase n=1 Tax=Curvibacter sp. CHRR-16 TaxID=2835872 RepID=UPI001BD9EE23|nr:nucleoside hydrolase [Curvibacter sp. CHRR-16]MBT0570149.1 nucleoside hydrolase [Curvibacter sp. CHRR-16]
MNTRTKVIIDTDVDFDDYMAIVYLMLNPQIEVVAISVTGCGAVHLSKGVENVANLLTLFGQGALHLPILRGTSAPLSFSNVFPADVRNGADIHYEAPFPATNPSPVIHNAQDWLHDFFINNHEPITILSIGGGTNFGTLFRTAQQDPILQAKLKSGIQQIVMMGGNILPRYITPGAVGNIEPTLGSNVIYRNTVAEWNIFIDPLGAQLMFEFGVPLRLIALNATNDVPLDQGFVDALKSIDTPAAKFLSAVLAYPGNAAGIGTYLSFWDPLAACTIAVPSLVSTQVFPLMVYQELNEEDDQSASLIVDAKYGSPIDVAISANKNAVYSEFLRVMRLSTT